MKAFEHSTDSTFTLQSLAWPSIYTRPSLFTSHNLKVKSFASPVKQQYPADWIVASMLACFILLAWLQFFYFKRLRQILRAPVSQRFLNIMIKEGSLFNERISLGLGLIYLFTSSFLLFLVLTNILPGLLSRYCEPLIFSLCASSVIVFWFLKVFLMRFLGIVFQTLPTTYVYIHNVLAFSFITGLLLLPLLILTVFLHSNNLLYITLIITGLLYFYRVMRGFFIGISLKKFSRLYLFVYLCALEILPMLIILKGLYLLSKGF